MRDKRKVHCSFCGKHEDEVARVFTGPAVAICDECVEMCNQIGAEIREKAADKPGSSARNS